MAGIAKDRVMDPAIDAGIRGVKKLFASGATAAAENAVADEAVANATGAVAIAIAVISKAFDGVKS